MTENGMKQLLKKRVNVGFTVEQVAFLNYLLERAVCDENTPEVAELIESLLPTMQHRLERWGYFDPIVTEEEQMLRDNAYNHIEQCIDHT